MLEQEYKFLILGPIFSAEALKTALAAEGFSLSDHADLYHEDRYFDTQDSARERAGLALRQRSDGKRRWATLKARGTVEEGLHRREELEGPLEDNWPEEIRARLDGLLKLEQLKPLLTLHLSRRRYRVLRGENLIAEISLDQVRAEKEGKSARFRELEIEAKEADPGQLARLAEIVERLAELTPNPTNKLEKARKLLEAL